jgi:hypothetical protein
MRTSFKQKRTILKMALCLIEELLSKATWSTYEVIAMGTLLQNIYTGVENLLRFKLLSCNITLPKTENWHKELLLSAAKEGLLTNPQLDGFRDLLLFRHLHVHGYGHKLNENRLRELATPVPTLCREFLVSSLHP